MLEQTRSALLSINSLDRVARDQAQSFLQSCLPRPGFEAVVLELLLTCQNSDLQTLTSSLLKSMAELKLENASEAEMLAFLGTCGPALFSRINPVVSRTFQEVIYSCVAKHTKLAGEMLGRAYSALGQSSKESATEAVWIIHSVLAAIQDSTTARSELNQLGVRIMPTLLTVLAQVQQSKEESDCELIHGLLKCFYVLTFLELPLYLKGQALHPWMVCLKNLLDRPLSPACHFDKSNKWAVKIVARFLQKHTDDKSQFGEAWKRKYSLPFVESSVSQLFQARECPLPQKTLNHLLRMISFSLKTQACWEKIATNWQKLVMGLVLPMLQLSADQRRMMAENPIEFVRRDDDQCFSCPRNSLSLLIVRLMADSQLNLAITTRLVQTLATGFNECLSYILSKVGEEATKNVQSQKVIVWTLAQLVPKGLVQEDQLTKARCLQLVHSCEGFNDIPIDNAIAIAQACLQSLFSTCTLLRVRAGQTLAVILKRAQISPKLQEFSAKIMNALLALVGQFQNEDLLSSLEIAIETFNKQVANFSLQLVNALITLFRKFKAQEKEQNEEEDSEQRPSGHCLSAIRQVLQCELAQPQVEAIAGVVLEEMARLLADRNQADLLEALNIINLVVYRLDHIPQNCAFLFPMLLRASTGLPPAPNVNALEQAIVSSLANPPDDLLQNTIGLIRNYVAKSGNSLSNQFVKLLFDAVNEVEKRNNQQDSLILYTALISLLEHLPARMPEITYMVVEQSIASMSRGAGKLLQAMCLQVLSVAVWLAPDHSLKLLESKAVLRPVLESICSLDHDNLYKWESRRVSLGLIRVVERLRQLPMLADLSSRLVVALGKCLLSVVTQEEEEAESDCAMSEDSGEDELDEDWEEQLNKLVVTRLEEVDVVREFGAMMSGLAQGAGWVEHTLREARVWDELVKAVSQQTQ